jgi:hypothetical protein
MSEVNIQPNLEIERNWAMLAHLTALLTFCDVVDPEMADYAMWTRGQRTRAAAALAALDKALGVTS